MNKIKLTKGFTLIELLVVIAIIGILGSIVYAPFQTARRKARDAQKIIEMKNLQASLNLFADSNNGYFPTTLVNLQTSSTDKLPSKANLTDTFDANKYNYATYSQGSNIIGFHLYTHLETASPALSGAANCLGVNTTGIPNTTSCISGPTGITALSISIAGAQAEPDSTKADFLNATLDSDASCATDLSNCIYDLKS